MDTYWKDLLQSDKKNAYIQTGNTINTDLNAYIMFDPDDDNMRNAQKKTSRMFSKTSDIHDDALVGVPFAIKNNIAIENTLLSCASEILSNFESPITASAVRRLFMAGSVPVGITNLDEFGMGSDTTHTIFNLLAHYKKPPTTFTEKIKLHRLYQGLNQKQFVQLFGVDPTIVKFWEGGERKSSKKMVGKFDEFIKSNYKYF